MSITPWSWERSNGSATEQQTIKAYNALTTNMNTSLFSRFVWNDIVQKAYALCLELGSTWNNHYLSQSNTLMSEPYSSLSAKMFNSLRYNTHYPTWTWNYDATSLGFVGRTDFRGAAEVGGTLADAVFGYYIIELTDRLNFVIGIVNDTVEPIKLDEVLPIELSTNSVPLSCPTLTVGGVFNQSVSLFANPLCSNLPTQSLHILINPPICIATLESEEFSKFESKINIYLSITKNARVSRGESALMPLPLNMIILSSPFSAVAVSAETLCINPLLPTANIRIGYSAPFEYINTLSTEINSTATTATSATSGYTPLPLVLDITSKLKTAFSVTSGNTPLTLVLDIYSKATTDRLWYSISHTTINHEQHGELSSHMCSPLSSSAIQGIVSLADISSTTNILNIYTSSILSHSTSAEVDILTQIKECSASFRADIYHSSNLATVRFAYPAAEFYGSYQTHAKAEFDNIWEYPFVIGTTLFITEVYETDQNRSLAFFDFGKFKNNIANKVNTDAKPEFVVHKATTLALDISLNTFAQADFVIASSWVYPEQTNNNLKITQAYHNKISENTLEVN